MVPWLIGIVNRPRRIEAPIVPAPEQPVVTNDQRPSKSARVRLSSFLWAAGLRLSSWWLFSGCARLGSRGPVISLSSLPMLPPALPCASAAAGESG
jgi:hypothetical protein